MESEEKWGKCRKRVKSVEKWRKVVEKWRIVGKSGEKIEKSS